MNFWVMILKSNEILRLISLKLRNKPKITICFWETIIRYFKEWSLTAHVVQEQVITAAAV